MKKQLLLKKNGAGATIGEAWPGGPHGTLVSGVNFKFARYANDGAGSRFAVGE